MPNKCVAFGCKTGYDRQESGSDEVTGDKPTLHSFPKDKTLFDKWVKAISRKDFVPSQYSRVCSKHFLPSDFVEVSEDSNVTRHKPKTDKKLMNRYLKKDAVPSIFDNVPSYLTGNRTTPRTTKATASNRRQRQADELDFLSASFTAHDDVSHMTVDEIEQRLSTESTRPTGFTTCVYNGVLLTYMICVEDGVPRISASVTINDDLTVCVSVDGQRTPSSQFSDIVNSSLKTMSQFINLMARVKSWAEEPQSRDADFFIQTALNSLESSKNHLDDEDEKSRIASFSIEQCRDSRPTQ